MLEPLFLYVVVILVALYIYGTWNFNLFKNVVGCSGPKPLPFIGTMHHYFKKGLQVDLDLKKQYGRSYGTFDGLNPVFVTGDLDIIKEIAIKKFDCFMNHRRVCINYPLNKALGMIKDDDWRFQRPTLSRAITAAKLKKISKTVDDCAKEMVQRMDRYAETGEMFEIMTPYSSFTMDVISQTQFAINVHPHESSNHPFIVHANKMFSSWSVFQPAMLLYMFLPSVLPFIDRLDIKWFKIFPADSVAFFRDAIMNVIKGRGQTSEKYTDILQLLLDSRTQSQVETEEEPEEGASHLLRTADKINAQMAKGVKSRYLTDMEICGSCITFLLAGYETTAMTLAWASYALSLHQDVQERLYEEIRQTFAEKGIDYDTVMKMQYLDQVINETLRRYSVIMRTDRVCNKTCQIGPYTIPKGMVLQISAIGVHFDEEYWPDPMKFDPDRFAPENRHKVRPNSILTFGVGPRICMGMRFAMLEIKIGLVHTLLRYQILPCEKTENPVKFAKHQLAIAENGIWVTLKRRSP